MSRTLWITGATGFVGSHFTYRVLKTTDARIVALVRARGETTPKERLLRALEKVAHSYREHLDRDAVAARIHAVSGDIELENCGISWADVPQDLLSPGIEFWHAAASLSFEDKYVEQIRRQNVAGTQHALALADQLAVARFIYVSTAYTCGRCEGEIAEALHPLTGPFNNAYEASKAEAEHAVAAWAARSARAASILRPSVVVGPRQTYAPGGSTSGVYGFAREISRLKRMLEDSKTELVMLGQPDAPINVIPVDDLARAMCEHAAENFAGGFVHHLTSATVPTVGRLLAIVGEQCGAGAIRVVEARDDSPSPVEQVVDRRAEFYSSYLRAPKTFARRAGPAIHVSDQEMEWFVAAYANQRRSGSLDALFTRESVLSEHGHTLTTYRCGARDLPALVLINAYGLPTDVWMPLASALKADFHVLTWELRMHAEDPTCTPDGHVSDLRNLLDHYGIAQAHVAGYCTGADLALHFAALHPERVHRLACLSGALNLVGATETPFQLNMRRLARRAAGDLAHARLYHQLLFGQRRGHYGMLAAERAEEAMLAAMVTTLDPALLHLTSAPFRDAETLHAYARSMQEHYRVASECVIDAVHAPTLVLTGLRDEVAHPEASRRAAETLGDATLMELPEADHFAVFTEPVVAELLRAHMLERRVRVAHEREARATAPERISLLSLAMV